jgi:hypothetical protein
MEPSSNKQHFETRDSATGTNIRDRKILNDSDLLKFDQSSYENKGGPVAVESVALVYFQPVLFITRC